MPSKELAKGLDFHRDGLFNLAEKAYKRACKESPSDGEVYALLALVQVEQSNFADALASVRRAERLLPVRCDWRTLNHCAYVFLRLGLFSEAAGSARRALENSESGLAPKINLLLALAHLGDRQNSVSLIDELLMPKNQSDDVVNQCGAAALILGEYSIARSCFESLVEKGHRQPSILLNLANAFVQLRLLDRGQTLLQTVDHCDPIDRAQALAILGAIEHARSNHLASKTALQEAVLLDSSRPDYLVNLCLACNDCGDWESGLEALTAAYQLSPDFPYLFGRLLHQRMQCADWSNFYSDQSSLIKLVALGRTVAEPFGFQAICDDPAVLKTCAELYAKQHYKTLGSTTDVVSAPIPISNDCGFATNRRLRIGFVGGEFRAHATLILLIGLIEHLNRSLFEIIVLDNGQPDDSDLRRRLESCAEVRSISAMGSDEVIVMLSALKFDALFNLNGYFGNVRHEIFDAMTCPVQINYLGFPGTLGTPCHTHLIADRVVIPEFDSKYYTERVAYLPNCYQPNDNRRWRGAGMYSLTTRSPFVFCSFNNTYKLTPPTFKLWCRILQLVPNSVLWLLSTGKESDRRIAREASRLGVSFNRIVFHGRVPHDDHLLRLSRADLFLDTFPYNAHTTGSDALWVGVPVLTVKGTSFPGRVGESLLKAVMLDDILVACDEEDYVKKAVEIALNSEMLAHLKSHLQKGAMEFPLFDTAEYTRDFEVLLSELIGK